MAKPRGLTAAQGAGEALPTMQSTLVALDQIDAGDNGSGSQDRNHFDVHELQALSRDIDRHGLLSPPIIRRVGDRYQIVAGERRIRAVRLLGWTEIACTVRELADDDARAIMAAENLMRLDLRPSEEAHLVTQRLADTPDAVTELAASLGRRVSWVRDRVALARLCPEAAHEVDVGALGIRHGVAMSNLSPAAQRTAAGKGPGMGLARFSGLVTELEANENQAALFDTQNFTLTTQQWDQVAERYIADTHDPDPTANAHPRRELWDIADIASVLGVRPATVQQWISRKVFTVQPTRYFSKTPVYWSDEIMKWGVESGRITLKQGKQLASFNPTDED